ncbi:hypothetical protein Bhyg_06228 [Pseudolycoriella hygida]|uniref:Uncharacterized protein n=1 Tax=Pseudolycoriella hygida TaxID=35572 RepID=A0A9Q0S0S4_9DIPT|nr:hypothetical protein Bhyg_06228 [Pseudolycoriella hygida]
MVCLYCASTFHLLLPIRRKYKRVNMTQIVGLNLLAKMLGINQEIQWKSKIYGVVIGRKPSRPLDLVMALSIIFMHSTTLLCSYNHVALSCIEDDVRFGEQLLASVVCRDEIH